jgi:signal transduction histidine kinase
MPHHVYDGRSNGRLVSVVRALLLCAVISLPTPVLGLYEPDPTFTISLVTMVGLTFLAVAYGVVLLLAARERWRDARRLAFCIWSVYGASVITLYHPDLDPIVQAILLTVGSLFLVVVQNATLALAPWQEARGWIALGFAAYVLASARLVYVHDVNRWSLGSLVVVTTFLCAAAAWPSRTLTRDLEEALEESENRRLDALDMRQEAADARDHALAANTAKSRFLANMSHELRTPLNAIIGYVELIQDEAADREVDLFDDDLQRIQSAGTHLLGLINAILDLSKIEAGRMEVVNSTVEPGQLLDDLANTVRPLAHDKRLELSVALGQDLPTLRTDAQKLRQVLLNLLANAVNFTDDGSIVLAAERDDAHLVFRVQDSGVGIAPARMDRIFDAFERTEAEITTRVGGTGLGLAISRRICELLGGTLTAQSQVGTGSTFTARIPIEPPLRRRSSLDRTPPPALAHDTK